MTVIRMRRLLVVAAGTTGALLAVAGPAGAVTTAPHPAPLCGALNMLEASPLYPYAVSTGMATAMTADTVHGSGANGNAGMFGAVAASSDAQSTSCTGG